MLPHLSPLNGGSAGAPVRVPPPPKFRMTTGPIHDVHFCEPPFKSHGRTAAQKYGVRYEKKVQRELKELLAPDFRCTALSFVDNNGFRICVPDGIYVHAKLSLAAAFEIKAWHTSDAWWQLRHLYEPALRAMHPTFRTLAIEVCNSYDPMIPFPEKSVLIEDLKEFLWNSLDGTLGILKWKL